VATALARALRQFHERGVYDPFAILQKSQQRLESIPGVEGIGIGGTEDAAVVLIMVRQV
jgi:hypothetical protein